MRHIFSIKGFSAFITVVFLNAFIDLGHKIIVQNTVFKTFDGDQQVILTAIINAFILLPFILMFSPSGYISDKYPKHKVIRFGAMLAVAATLLITACYYAGWFWAAFGLTLLLAIQSAIYSPAKYGYIKELVGDENIAQTNALVQATTIIAILSGTFAFSILFENLLDALLVIPQQPGELVYAIAPLGWMLVTLAMLECLFAWSIPAKSEGHASLSFSAKQYAKGGYLKQNIGAIRENKTIWLSIVGLSVFWAISQVMLASFPAYIKDVFAETNTVIIQGILACTGIGVLLGSVIAGRLSRAYIELGLIPIGALGVAMGLLMVTWFDSYLMLGFAFFVIGWMGGMFIVPLNSLIQYTAKEENLGVILAGNNWVQNITMLFFLVLTVIFSISGINSLGLFYILTVTALLGAVYTIKQLPQSLARLLVGAILKRKYKVDVIGFENLPKEQGVLLLGNHISWIDWALVQIACPRPIRFVMLRSIYERWYLKPFLKFFGAIPISAGNSKASLEAVNQCLQNGEVVCLFPEGAISRNGHLGAFKTGYERAVEGLEDDKVCIVPFYLRGLWGSKLSRSDSDKLRENTAQGVRRDIIVAFGKSLPLSTKADALKQKVFELSIDAWDRHISRADNVPYAWLKKAKSQLSDVSVVETSGVKLSNAKVVAASLAFSKRIARLSKEQNIGLLLPSSSAAIIANMAIMLKGKTAVNLNYTSSIDAVRAGIRHAGIESIYTSRKFVEKLAQKGIDIDAMVSGCRVYYMEDLKETISKAELLRKLIMVSVLPASVLYQLYGKRVSIDAPAQILFSSGSEGTPKGIVLSHRNLMGNIKQISDVLNTQENDVVMASLPPFHSFGLTVTSLMPMIEGLPAVCHPDPTDALNIAKAVARYEVSIMCGTATFLRLYARNKRITPLMFDSLRVVVAGAEKLNAEVREAFELKFKKAIYEGYGATETTPVASVNVPDKLDRTSLKAQVGNKPGTVGLPLPGSCFRIVDPDTYETLPLGEDGLILIAGSQVMLGYLNDEEKTSAALVNIDGRRWYKTGDKGHLDADGFLTIVDRYSRFAKIGGEMISLGAVEASVKALLDNEDAQCVAVNVKDDKKGEKVMVLVEGLSSERCEDLKQAMIKASVNPLMIPSAFHCVDAIPALGSGKTDYAAVKQLAASLEA